MFKQCAAELYASIDMVGTRLRSHAALPGISESLC